MKAARVYADRLNWRVLPVIAGDKRPAIDDWPNQATNDADVIDAWISEFPHGNVGVATGTASGFFVLDVDTDKGGGESLAELVAEHGELPLTPQQRTGSGGSHYLFQLPDFTVTNSAGKIGKGLDTRGNGGQIVVAPSVSAKGAYRWIRNPRDTPLAPAPAWLLERLRAPSARPLTPTAAASTDRGFFPPASPAVIDAVRQALERHGPGPERVDGEGGGQHTVQAGSILMHDFALTEAEAWPLLVEWNETRTPPFDHDELRERLHRGERYGKAEYGARRRMDAYARATKLIEDWRLRGAFDAETTELRNGIAAIVDLGLDKTTRALIERDLATATGLGVRALDVPKARAETPDLDADEIAVTPRIHEVADDSIKAISDHVFQRNGLLCEIVTPNGKPTFVSDLKTARIQDVMSRVKRFVRFDDGEKIEQVAPLNVAEVLHSRREHPIRILDGVTTAPIFLANGEILQTPGYNAESRFFLQPSVTVDVADEPSRADAVDAIAVLRNLLRDFKFATPADFSSWLAALLSPLVKSATGNAPAPLFCISASSPGAGKTLLADVLSQIVSGTKIENSPYNPKDPAEWGKRLTAFVKAAIAVRAFDNCNGPFGDENLDRLITASTWSDRILGVSDAPPLPNVTTWLATGNNIEPHGDTVRRVLVIRIEVDTEKPQERQGFTHDLEGGYALENRGEFLSAALTILRAYHIARRPMQPIFAWGSFSPWSRLVRQALVWAGEQDPFLTQRRAQLELNEPDNVAHDFWLSIVERSDGTANAIAALANSADAVTVLNMREQLNAFTLRRFLGRFVGKVRAGKRVRQDHNPVRYYVERVT